MNHSENPNSQIRYPENKSYKDIVSYTLTDIKAGD
jgi:SET domain-containing protein